MFSKLFKKQSTEELNNRSGVLENLDESKIEENSSETIKQNPTNNIDVDFSSEVDNIEEISEEEEKRMLSELTETIKEEILNANTIDEVEENIEAIENTIGITELEWQTVYNNPNILGYESRTQQALVFGNVLPSEFDVYSDTILDVGCGIGDLWAYCNEVLQCDDPLYTGIDIDEDIITKAKIKFPEVANSFSVQNLDEHTQTHDWVVAMSAFNEHTFNDKKSMYIKIEDIIDKMYSLANKGVALNLMHTYLKETDKESLQVFNPYEIFKWASTKYYNVKIHKNYIDRDFILYIYK